MITFGRTFTFLADLNNGNPINLYLLKGPILGYDEVTFQPIFSYDYSMSLFTNPAGAFLVLGIVLAVIAAIKNGKETKAKVDERLAKAKAKEGGQS
jgi:hypothetical protein